MGEKEEPEDDEPSVILTTSAEAKHRTARNTNNFIIGLFDTDDTVNRKFFY
jgi:hypothetical protein